MKNFNKVLLICLSLMFGLTLFPLFAPSAEAQAVKKCFTKDDCDALIQKKIDKKLTGRIISKKGCDPGTGACVLDNLNIDLNVALPGQIKTVKNYDDYIARLFEFLLGAAGVVSIAMLVLGGYTYITAAGNQARVGKAKEFMVDALIGLVLVFGSVIFLGQINKALVSSDPLSVEVVAPDEQKNLPACQDPDQVNGKDAVCGMTTTEKDNGSACRSFACKGSNETCLPFDAGQISGTGLTNQVAAFRCYDKGLSGLIEACTEAPTSMCDVINTGNKKDNWGLASSNPTGDACASSSNGCVYGDKILKCPNSYKQVDCSICERGYNPVIAEKKGWFTDATELYCQYPVGIAWSKDDSILPLDHDQAGAICCRSKGGAGSYISLNGEWYGDEFWCSFSKNWNLQPGECHPVKF